MPYFFHNWTELWEHAERMRLKNGFRMATMKRKPGKVRRLRRKYSYPALPRIKRREAYLMAKFGVVE
jgi:hypothetical protein